MLTAFRQHAAPAMVSATQQVRMISFFHKIKLGERPVNVEKKEKYEEKFKRATKTRLCEEFRTTGECVWGDRCLSAHSLAELQPPVYFDAAVDLAKKDFAPHPNHHHLLEAQIQACFRKKRGFKPVLDTLRAINGCELGASLMVEYVPATLLKEQMVEKAYIQVKCKQLANTWFLSEPQMWALKQVIGQRYKPEKDLFRLTRRNHQPYREILNYETVYDHNIMQLYEIAKGVRELYPEPYADADNCSPVRASTSFTPEYVFDYDNVQHCSADKFSSPYLDETCAVATSPNTGISPAYEFEMDTYRPKEDTPVFFDPEPDYSRPEVDNGIEFDIDQVPEEEEKATA